MSLRIQDSCLSPELKRKSAGCAAFSHPAPFLLNNLLAEIQSLWLHWSLISKLKPDLYALTVPLLPIIFDYPSSCYHSPTDRSASFSKYPFKPSTYSKVQVVLLTRLLQVRMTASLFVYILKDMRVQAVCPSCSPFLLPVLSGSLCWTIRYPRSSLPLLAVSAPSLMFWIRIFILQEFQPPPHLSLPLSLCVFVSSS